MYSRTVFKSTTQESFHMILSTIMASGKASTYLQLKRLEVRNIHLEDVTYEGGSSLIAIYALDTIISNFTAKRIGSYSIKS